MDDRQLKARKHCAATAALTASSLTSSDVCKLRAAWRADGRRMDWPDFVMGGMVEAEPRAAESKRAPEVLNQIAPAAPELRKDWASCVHRGTEHSRSEPIVCVPCNGAKIWTFFCNCPEVEKDECTIGNEKQRQRGNDFGLAMCYGCSHFRRIIG